MSSQWAGNRGWSGLAVLIALLAAPAGGNALSAPPAGINEKILRIDVPADRPDVWAREARSLIAIPRAEFEQLLQGSEVEAPGPRPAQVTTAHYTATLAGSSLRGGSARLSVQRVGDAPVLLPLGRFSLAVRDLAWTDRSAVWGTDTAGDSWLLVDSPGGEVEFSWSAVGRPLGQDLSFDLPLPPAAMSTLDVRVPRDQAIRSTPEARRIDEGSDAAWQVYRIQMGSERRCRIAAAPVAAKVDRSPTILFEHELGAIVREQDLRFQTVFQVEVFDAPVTELTFTVPSSVDVFAVTYGQDVPLKWTRPARPGSGTLHVTLPGAVIGRSRPIRIDGVAVQKPNSPMIAPQIAVKDGVFVGGRQTLTIVAPLQLRSFRPTGFRQLTPATITTQGENYTFLQLVPDAQLVLEVGRPQASLTAQAQSLFEMDDSAWTLTTELTWIASSGGVFQTECQFPADWEITDVRLATELGTARLAGWDATVQSGGQLLLTVEFLEALAPTVPRTIRVLARRRPLGTGTTFALPLAHPVNCYSVESTLGLILPSTFSPFVSEDARLERTAPPDDSLWALRPRRQGANQNEFWYRRESTDGGGSLQLVSRLRRVAATSETVVAATPAEYSERYAIRCQTEGAPIDRLLVYLTQPGAEARWSILSPKPGELVAARLPVAQNADWNCPATGELWELRLPPLPAGPVRIEGRRSSRWLPESRPALLVVPQSTDRRSQVTLRHPASLDLAIETTGLDRLVTPVPEDADGQDMEPASAVAAIVNERAQSWSFEDPDAQLTLTLKNPERSREFPTMVSLRLRSLLSANPQGFDLYRAQIRLENGTSRDEIRVRLPSSAIVQQVLVAGEATSPNRQGDELLLSDLDATRRDMVELLYRVPSQGDSIRDVHRIVVPQVSARVLSFSWQFALPPSVNLYAQPEGVHLTRPLAAPTWTERFFGPLGRPADERFFNPFAVQSWQELWRPGPVASAPLGELSRELIAPAEWQVHDSIAAVAPAEIVLVTWDSRQTRLLAWIALVVNLMIGVVLRLIGWKYRDRVAAYWLALMVASATFSPAPYAELMGGAIAGTVIALLCPRRSLISPRQDSIQTVPLGSTHSFDWGAAQTALLLALVTGTGSAQDPAVSSPAAGTATPAAPGRFVVLVPVDADDKPSKQLPLVYLPQQLLTLLKDAAREEAAPPQSLVAAADYTVAAGSNGVDSMQARFRIHVLDASRPHQIVLPVADAFLTGTAACKVNGQPHPAQIAPGGQGFVVTLNPAAESADSPAAEFVIEFDLKRVGIRTALGGSFLAKVPGVAASRWSLTLPEPAAYLDISGALGAMEAAADRRTCVLDAGASPSIEVRWSQTPPEPRPQRIEVTQLQFLDLRSAHGELRFRLRCEPAEGQIDFIDLDLPPRSLVREGDIRAAGLLRTDVIGGPGQSRLRLTFSEPQRQKFTVDGTILIAIPEGITQLALPQFGLTRSAGLRVTTIQNWWCVSSPSEYRLDHQNLDGDLQAGLSSADFLQAWGESPPTGRLLFVFQPREGSMPQFSVTPQVPRRRVISWAQTGTVGRRRLDWTLSARLETTQAPVYQHFLLVDRRLQIESISVVEGGAERLVRWSENRSSGSPTRVVLFLSDKTTGVQQLILKGSLPTRYGRLTALPFVRCEEAELVDSRWELFHDRDVEVDLTLPRGVGPLDAAEEPETPAWPKRVAQYQTADPDPRTSIRVSAVQARCSARMAVALSRGEGTAWKIAGQLKLTPEGESPRRLGVQFPAGFDPARVRVDHAEANWHDPAEGRRRLDLTLPPEPGEVAIAFETVVDEPGNGEWELPLPLPQEATSQQLYLLAGPADTWTPLEGTELKPDESPNWAAEILADLRPEGTSAVYQLGTLPVRLRRSPSATHLDQPEIRLLDHSLWVSAAGERHGITRAYLSQTREGIRFAVPAGFQPVAVFLDDRPLSLPVPRDGKLEIPLIGGARESLLALSWRQPTATAGGPAQLVSEELPLPLGITVARTLVTVIPDHGGLVIAGGGTAELDWLDAALDRLEMLLDRQDSLGNDPRAAAANLRLIFDLQTQIAERLPRKLEHPSPRLTSNLDRWNRLVSRLNQLDPLSAPRATSAADSPVLQVEEPFLDLPQALRLGLSPSSRAISVWLFDRRWIGAVGALSLGLIAIPLFRRLIRLDWGEWLSKRTMIAWLLLGLVWWLWLSPGFIGPLIVVVTALRSAMHRRQARQAVMVMEG